MMCAGLVQKDEEDAKDVRFVSVSSKFQPPVLCCQKVLGSRVWVWLLAAAIGSARFADGLWDCRAGQPAVDMHRWAKWCSAEAPGFCHVQDACHQSSFPFSVFSVNLRTLLAILCWFCGKFVKPILWSLPCFQVHNVLAQRFMRSRGRGRCLHATALRLA